MIIKMFHSDRGKNLIYEWLEEQNQQKAVRAKFIEKLKALRDLDMCEWKPPHFTKLSGQYSKLGKLRFNHMQVEFRPIGFFGPNVKDFTLLVGANEKGSKLLPPNVCDVAMKRMQMVNKNPEQANEWDF